MGITIGVDIGKGHHVAAAFRASAQQQGYLIANWSRERHPCPGLGAAAGGVGCSSTERRCGKGR